MISFFDTNVESLLVDPILGEPISFLADEQKDKQGVDLPNLIFAPSPSRPNRRPMKLLAMGYQDDVNSVIHELYRRGFAEVSQWSRPIRARHPQEIIRVLTRYFVINS